MGLTNKQKEEKKKILKKIHDHKQTRVIWILVAIFLSWTIIGLFIGIGGIIWASEAIRKKEQKLVDFE